MRRFEGLGPCVAIALLMASGACEPPPTQPEGGRTPRDDGSSLRLSGAGGLSVEDTTDIYATPAYEVDLQIDGSLRPGEPLSITATATANVPVPNTELRLLLPEVRAAESGAPAEFRVPVKQRIPAYGRVTRSLQAGQAASVSGSVPIPHPGYYRALAVAVDTMVSEGELAAATGGFVQTHVFRRLWLFVSPDGGRVTEVFDTTLIADSLRAQPGPFRPRWSTPVGTRNASAGPSVWFAGNMATTTSNPQPYEYELLYDKDQNGIMEPVPDAKVTVTHYPVVPPFGQDPIVVQKWTDSNGRFTVSCFTTHSHYIVTTSGSNADVEIGGLGNASGQYDDCAQGVNLEQQIIANTEKAQLYVYMNEVIPASRSLLGRSRGKIQIDLDPGASNSFYSPWQDRVVIKSGSGGHIFGSFGRFVAPHEYGHAVHHKALGGLNPDFNDNCSPHEIGQLSSMGCALSEGFADYHGVATGGSAAAFHTTISARVLPATVGDSTVDAAEDEGAVAAFLFDLTDPADESHDEVEFPGSYVSAIMESCMGTTVIETTRASGIDHIVHCFEQGVHTEVKQHRNPEFFSPRTYKTISISETASEPAGWCLVEVRDLWVWNIYNLRAPIAAEGCQP